MYLHEQSLDVFHPHHVPLDNKTENLIVSVPRQRFCPVCSGKGFKHSNLYGTDAPLRGPCITCNGAAKVRVPKSSQGSSSSTMMRRTRSDEENEAAGLIEMISLKCKTCHGTGKKLTPEDICPKCRGYEVVTVRDDFELYLHNGRVVPGEVFEFEGQGNQHRKIETDEKTQGNLYIYLDHYYPHPIANASKLEIENRVQQLLIKGEKLSTEPNKLYRPAITAFSQALELDRKNAVALAKRAGVRLLLKEFSQARYDAEAAIEANSMFYEGYLYLGDACQQLGQVSDAIKSYKQAKFLAPDKEIEEELQARILSLEKSSTSNNKNYIAPAATNTHQQQALLGQARKPYQPPVKQFTATFANVANPTSNNNIANSNQHLQNKKDLELTCEVTPQEAANGTTKTVSVVRATRCDACRGTGSIDYEEGQDKKQQQQEKPSAVPVSEDDAMLELALMMSLSQEKGLVLDHDDDHDETKLKNKNNNNNMMMMMMEPNNNNSSKNNNDDNNNDDIPLRTLSQTLEHLPPEMRERTLDSAMKKFLSTRCPVCSGWGVTNESKKFDIVLQPGTDVMNTTPFYFPGEGNQIKGGSDASRGTLRIKIVPSSRPLYAMKTTLQDMRSQVFAPNAFYDDEHDTTDEDEDDDGASAWGQTFEGKNIKYNHHHHHTTASQAQPTNTKSAWLLDLAKKHNLELSDSAIRMIIHQHQIDRTTFLLMEKSDVDMLGLPMGPRLALLKILENEKKENK